MILLMGSTNTLNNQGLFSTVHFLLPFTVQPHPKTYYIPRPSKGCQMVPKDLSIHHPLGFNWHPLEGAGSFLLPFTFPEKNPIPFPKLGVRVTGARSNNDHPGGGESKMKFALKIGMLLVANDPPKIVFLFNVSFNEKILYMT